VFTLDKPFHGIPLQWNS